MTNYNGISQMTLSASSVFDVINIDSTAAGMSLNVLANDYVRTDNGFNNHRTGWTNGDFNYNNIINFDDYVLIELAFNTQSDTLRR